MKIFLSMLAGAAILFIIAGIAGQSSKKPSEEELKQFIQKAWVTCDAQFSSRNQSAQHVDCLDKLMGAYIEGVRRR
jgi:hypothetical protein